MAFGVLFLTGGVLFGGGAKEKVPELAEADALIKVKNYSDAIQLLTEFARENPDQFDNVQKRMRTMMTQMGSYTVIANTLLDMVINNPENSDEIMAIGRQLGDMNAARHGEIEEFIANIEEYARLSVNRRELERILREGADLLERQEYLAALEMYESGFDLYQEQMYDAGYGDEVNETVRNNLQTISDFIASAQTTISASNNAVSSLSPLQDSAWDSETVSNAYNSMAAYFDNLVAAKETADQSARYFDEQAKITENAEVKKEGRYFFAMAMALIRGRSNEQFREGILGSIDAVWNIAALPLENHLHGVSEALFSQITSEISNDNFATALTMLSNLNNLNRNALAMFDELTAFATPDSGTIGILGRLAPENMAHEFLYALSMEQAVKYLSSGSGEGALFAAARAASANENLPAAWNNGQVSIEAAVAQELVWRRNYETYTGAIDSLLNELDAETTSFRGAIPSDQAVNERTGIQILARTRSTLENLRNKLLDAQINAAAEQYTMANGALQKELSRLTELFAENTRMLNGKPLTLEDGTAITAFYPREAAALSREIEASLQKQIETAALLLNDYQNENTLVSGNRGINTLAAEARSIASRLSALRVDNNQALTVALARINQSEELVKEGRQLFATASQTLSRSEFDEAREEADRSMARYNASLAIQESSELRDEIATRLTPLISEISRLRYQAVVMEVRAMVNNARDSYFGGNFETAEETLVRAEDRWTTISAEPETEIEYWLTLVRGAMFMRSGRTIPTTAPLYPEMSQLLSNARMNYEEGVRLLNSNNREDGMRMFASAMEKTQEIRLLFPVNQEAGILELQIEQVRDPVTFNQNFTQRFQTAVAGIQRGSVESYADLQNLAQINPRYPGINAAILQAEIDMGMRPAPPDPRRIARSNELAAAAQRMFSANIRSQYPLVLENVNEALRINPNNALAMQIKDRVQVAMGNASSVDSYTEQEYMRAVREFQNGNNLLALSIVQRLLQRPENRDSTRLNELLRRIQASM